MIALVAAIIAITLGVVVFADELVREGRYVLLDDTDQTISVHNELHVAIREGQDWSREHEGRTFRIEPPRYRGSATPDQPDPGDPLIIRVAPGEDIPAAIARLQPGGSLLFERGGVYRGGLGVWRVSGIDADRPTIVGSYGTGDPPLFLTDGDGLVSLGDAAVHDVIFRDLRAVANRRDPASPDFTGGDSTEFGVRWWGTGHGIRFERLRLDLYFQALDLSAEQPGDLVDITLDGCVLTRSYNTRGSHSQGLGAGRIRGLHLVDCVLDRNGWNPDVPNAPRTGFNHNAYIYQCSDVLIEGTVFSRGSNMGLKLRSDIHGGMRGVTVRGCLFVGNLTGIKASSDRIDGVHDATVIDDVTVEGNVITHNGGSPAGGDELGVGVELEQVDGAMVADNLFVDKTAQTNWYAINVATGLPFGGIEVRRNIVDRWPAQEPLINGSARTRVAIDGNLVNTGAATRRLADYPGGGGDVYAVVDAIVAGETMCAEVVAWLFGGVE